MRCAFDNGITHFDLANNYGPPYGTAEETFGKLMERDFRPYRDEMFICTKAGYDMWNGPYGNWGSRKYLMASLDQSLYFVIRISGEAVDRNCAGQTVYVLNVGNVAKQVRQSAKQSLCVFLA